MTETNFSIVILADTQRTTFPERWFLKRECNQQSTCKLLIEIPGHHPSAVIIVGDLVAGAYTSAEWQFFRSATKNIRDAAIPIWPAIGNHDRGIRHEFSFLGKDGWYSRSIGNLGLIWLNTNSRKSNQRDWLKTTLATMQSDPSIDHIVAFGHHPPLTNSKIVHPSKFVAQHFNSLLEQTPKFRALVSGHAHTFEKFVVNKKLYVVTGGGGGPRANGDRTPIHFIKLKVIGNEICFEVYGLEEDGSVHRLVSFAPEES